MYESFVVNLKKNTISMWVLFHKYTTNYESVRSVIVESLISNEEFGDLLTYMIRYFDCYVVSEIEEYGIKPEKVIEVNFNDSSPATKEICCNDKNDNDDAAEMSEDCKNIDGATSPSIDFENRCYVQVSNFAVAKFLYALQHCSDDVTDVTVSTEDDSLLVAFNVDVDVMNKIPNNDCYEVATNNKIKFNYENYTNPETVEMASELSEMLNNFIKSQWLKKLE